MKQIRIALKNRLEKKRERNAAYSLRAMARDLDISPATLSGFMTGNRNLSRENVLKVGKALGLSEKETVPHPVHKVGRRSWDEMNFWSNWHDCAILSLLETENCPTTVHGVAERLGLQQRFAKLAIDRLLRLGFIRDLDGAGWEMSGIQVQLGMQGKDLLTRKRHLRELDRAKETILFHARADKSSPGIFSTMTVACNSGRLAVAKVRMAKFRRHLAAYLEGGKKDAVFSLIVDLLPVTRMSQPKTGN